jgi:hypothetical protein
VVFKNKREHFARLFFSHLSHRKTVDGQLSKSILHYSLRSTIVFALPFVVAAKGKLFFNFEGEEASKISIANKAREEV